MPRVKTFQKKKTKNKFGWPRPSPNVAASAPRKNSTSKEKLDGSSGYDLFTEDEFKYDILDLDTVRKVISEIAVCKHCYNTLELSVSNRVGLAFTLNLSCSKADCGKNISERNCNLSTVDVGLNDPKPKVYDINVRFVYALRSIGVGQETGEMFAGIMNLPKPSKFSKYNKMLMPVTKMVCLETMKQAVEKAVEQNDGSRDLACAFDGSWQRRGFSSLNGVVTATSITTGQVLDVEVMSKFCRCKGRLEKNHEPLCISNYSGTSGGMEVAGVSKMFARSQENYGVRYKYYLGDGDCKEYDTVNSEQPYGPDFHVEKMECLGHIQKRMGKRLRTYKQKNSKAVLADGKKLGGQGRLTGHAIDTIQIFYGLAIRRNAALGVQAMKSAIWAEYFHLGSTDENPEHALCPKDCDTWCKYQKAQQDNVEYKHSEHTHLPTTIMQEIKPIFRDLSNPILLAKCTHGGTQNISESLNNVIWSRIPKRVFVELTTLQLGVFDAIAGYNKGNVSKCMVFKVMGLPPGGNCVRAMKLLDSRRIQRAEKAVEEVQKKCRQQTSLKRKKQEDEFEEREDPDNPPYSSGHY